MFVCAAGKRDRLNWPSSFLFIFLAITPSLLKLKELLRLFLVRSGELVVLMLKPSVTV